MKKGIVYSGLAIVAAGLIYVASNWPLNSNANLQGTLGGVQKAKKFRGEQLTENDVKISEQEVTKLTQSADWQNAMKDENFVKMFANGEFQNIMKMLNNARTLGLYSQKWNQFFANNDVEKISLGDFEAWLNQEFEGWKGLWNSDLKKLLANAQDFQKNNFANANENQRMKSMTFFVLNNSDFGNAIMNDKDLKKSMMFNQEGNKMSSAEDIVSMFYNNFDMEKMWAQDMQKVMAFSQDFNKFWSADFQKSIGAFSFDFNNENFQKLLHSNAFQSIVFHLHGNDFQNFLHSQAEMHGFSAGSW